MAKRLKLSRAKALEYYYRLASMYGDFDMPELLDCAFEVARMYDLTEKEISTGEVENENPA